MIGEVARVTVRAVSRLSVAQDFQKAFGGFTAEAFRILERLRQAPHIEQYRRERDAIATRIQEPFQRYRDDIVVGAILSNRIELETERNVFSRLLKNDFGKGGCHHHVWMSFYRPGWTRLRDLQLIHSLHPNAFYVGVSASDVSAVVLRSAQAAIVRAPVSFAQLIAPFTEEPEWEVSVRSRRERRMLHSPPTAEEWTEIAPSMKALRVLRRLGREEVVNSGDRLVDYALAAMADVWPLYLHLLPDE